MEPWDFKELHCSDTLCLSSRDLLSHLQRALRNQPARTATSNHSLSLLVPVLSLEDSSPPQLSP